MFDTHCHLNFKRFKKNGDEVIARAHESGVNLIVIPGTDVKTSKKAVELAEQYEGLYAAVGIHPHHVYKYLRRASHDHDPDSRLHGNDAFGILKQVQDDIMNIESMLAHPKVVAVGEVGMDRHTYEETVYQEYNVSPEFIQTQQQLLNMQIDLAVKHKKSLILHNREAKEDILPLLREKWDAILEKRAVFHCCEPDLELLSFSKEHKMYIGVDGDVTYDHDKQEFIHQVPLEMLVIETDSPYILPEPLLSAKKYPNEPANVRFVAEAVAKLKGESIDEVVKITTENGMKLFGIDK